MIKTPSRKVPTFWLVNINVLCGLMAHSKVHKGLVSEVSVSPTFSPRMAGNENHDQLFQGPVANAQTLGGVGDAPDDC